ncbi:MAG: hypothetical protein RL095_61 [Verrucomicrobiota bacterium]|jgi:O-acetyl-ADP-ribose deacetylase (regulator of RNase III)
MIIEVTGDILLSGAEALAHGVAPADHFDSGLALQLREKWPVMVKDFRHWCHGQNPKEGEIWAWAGAGAPRIVSLLVQEAALGHSGRPGRAHTEHVNHCLRALADWVRKEQVKSLALPRLATGVGHLDWAAVKPMIEKHLSGLGIPVYLYSVYEKGVKAEERAALKV